MRIQLAPIPPAQMPRMISSAYQAPEWCDADSLNHGVNILANGRRVNPMVLWMDRSKRIFCIPSYPMATIVVEKEETDG